MDRLRKVHLCRVYALVAVMCNIIPLLLYGDALSKLSPLGVICTFELIVFLCINAKLHGTILNFGTLFAMILYLFHFGQLVLYSFFKSVYSHIRILLLLDAEDVLYGFNCMHIAFSVICIGMVTSVIEWKKDASYIKTDLLKLKSEVGKIALPFSKFLPKKFADMALKTCRNLITLGMATLKLIHSSKVYKSMGAAVSAAWKYCEAFFCVLRNVARSTKVYTNHCLCVEYQKKNFINVAKYIIMCTFPFKLFIDLSCLAVFLTQGGLAAREWVNEFPNVFLYIGKVSLVGLAILMLQYKEQVKKQTFLFFGIESYILIAMISGIRSENVGYMCVFALLYFASAKIEIKFRHVVLSGAAGVCVLALIVTLGQLRVMEDKSFSAYWNVFWGYLTRQNVIFHLLDTCGDTGYTAQCVLSKWLPEYGPTGGDSYILGSTAIIPNIPGIFSWPGRMTEASCFAIRLQEAGTLSERYLNIGGSLLGELFFNFGVFGAIPFALLFGLWVGSVSHKCTRYINSNNSYGMLWLVPAMFAVTYWVRHYFGGQIREMVWGPVICLSVMKIVCIFQRSKNMREE